MLRNVRLTRTTLNTKTSRLNQISYSSTVALTKSYDEIPGPRQLPYIGSFLSLKFFGGEYDIFDYRKFQIDLQNKYGDIVKWNLGRKECFLFDPKHIKQVFKYDGNSPLRPTLDPLEALFKELKVKATLVNSQGERWRRLRTAANPVMARPQTIHSYLPIHNEISDDLVRIIKRKIDSENSSSVVYDKFDQNLKLLALEYISEITFDKRIRCMASQDEEIVKFVNSVNDFLVYAGRLLFQLPVWRYYPTKDWKKFHSAAKYIYDEATKYIKEAHDDYYSKKERNEPVKMTALSQFLENQKKYNIELDEIVAIMTDLLLGGVDTTSTAMHYFLYEMGKNPDVQEKLYQEINSVLKVDEPITEDHLSKLKYLKYSTKENFRIHLIAPGLARILQNDIIIDNYLIPKGTSVNFGLPYMAQSERFFKNPENFDPERWKRDEEGTEFIDPYSNLAFGFGSRMCIGRRTAEQEIYLTIAKLIHNFKIEYLGETPKMKIGLIATPDTHLKVKLTKRVQN